MPDKRFHFQVVTPERVVYEDDVQQVTIPTASGEITVLPGHATLVSLLVPGELRIGDGKKDFLLAVSGGMVYVANHKVTILADSAEHAEELEEQRVEEARQKAEELLKEKRMSDEEYATTAANLQRELARLKVIRKHRSKHGSQFPK